MDEPAPTIRQRKLQRRLTPTDVDQLVAAYCAGGETLELAARFQVHRNTVRESLKRRGIAPRRLGLDDAQIEETIRLYKQGNSLAQLGERFGVDASTVGRQLGDAGVELRAPWERANK